MNIKYIFLFFFLCSIAYAQSFLEGSVMGTTNADTLEPLPGAVLYWSGDETGVLSNPDGSFYLDFPEPRPEMLQLVIQYAGYQVDTMEVVKGQNEVEILLQYKNTDEVLIESDEKGTSISTLDPMQTEIIGTKELYRAACCNLSESFETNATVDVSYSDAVSGAKQIRMLGLDGVYTQIITENYPSIRGLATSFGLNYIPGPWMESIQVSKGVSSVLNGYESIAGQINVEYKKPENSPPLYVNLYANQMGRLESSILYAQPIGKKWHTMFKVNGNYFNRQVDPNGDGFQDMPTYQQLNVMNRWRYRTDFGLQGQFGARVLIEDRAAGQVGDMDENPDLYRIGIDTRRYEVFAKSGFVWQDKPYQSVGLILNGIIHEQNADWGLNAYEGREESFYAKLAYQTILGNSNHTFRAGGNFMYDAYDEVLNDSAFQRVEKVPGAYVEYSYEQLEKISVVAGFRADYNSLYDWVFTPRFHVRYAPFSNTVLRVAGGSGFRVPNAISENMPMLFSSRQVIITEALQPEEAWNYGVNATQYFDLFGKTITLRADFYRTDFQNQLVADRETPSQIRFYNLNGRSFSNALQTELSFEPIERLELKFAYKWTQVRTTFRGDLLDIPFVPRNRALANAHYTTPNKRWNFDFTTQFHGQQRLPNTENNPEAYRLDAYSPHHFILNAQVSHSFKWLDVYVGGENLAGFKQQNPILSAENPFGDYFDASMVWGPVFGRRMYAGIRMTISDEMMKGMETLHIKSSVQCGMCQETIQQGFADVEGIQKVEVDLATQLVSIKYDPKQLTPKQIRIRLTNLGYDADEMTANPAVYEDLPGCCQKP